MKVSVAIINRRDLDGGEPLPSLFVPTAHFLKNSGAEITKSVKEIPAKIRLLLSGTPIQNDLTEFFTLFNTAVPGLLGLPTAFTRQYQTPILRSQDSDATDAEVKKARRERPSSSLSVERFRV